MGLEKSSTVWRFNNEHLHNITFKNRKKATQKEDVEMNDFGEIAPIMVWEWAKAVLQGEIISYASKKIKEKETLGLQKTLVRLQSKHVSNGNLLI